MHEDGGEKALCGRVPMEGLIPRLRFLCGGVWLFRRSVWCFTGGLLENLYCVVPEVLFCVVLPEVRGCTPEFSFVVGSCSQRPRFRTSPWL